MDVIEYWRAARAMKHLTPRGKDDPEGGRFRDLIRNDLFAQDIVDFGCGSGRLAPCFNPADYLGLDISPFAIEAAREAHPKYTFAQDDEVSPIGAGRDVIFAHTVLLHVPDDKLDALIARFFADRVFVSEILGDEWRNDRNDPPVFNRGLGAYCDAFKAQGYRLHRVQFLPYAHYPNTDFAIMEYHNEKLLRDGAKGYVVVAHPDDEALWFAGLMLRYSRVNWTVICCSIPERDPIRAWKFFDSCRILGAMPRLIPLQESGATMPIRLPVLDILGEIEQEADFFVTHSKAGEYGHRHHIDLSTHFRSLPVNLIQGMYGVYGRDGLPPDIDVTLDVDEWNRKKAAILAYNHYSPSDSGVPKGDALLDRYSSQFDLFRERYTVHES